MNLQERMLMAIETGGLGFKGDKEISKACTKVAIYFAIDRIKRLYDNMGKQVSHPMELELKDLQIQLKQLE